MELIYSSVQIEASLSSSTALEMAMVKALRALFGLALNDIDPAHYAQQSGIRFVGIHCSLIQRYTGHLAYSCNLWWTYKSLTRYGLGLNTTNDANGFPNLRLSGFYIV